MAEERSADHILEAVTMGVGILAGLSTWVLGDRKPLLTSGFGYLVGGSGGGFGGEHEDFGVT